MTDPSAPPSNTSDGQVAADLRLAKYFTRVHAKNRHAGYGSPVEVIAATRQEAVNRAVAIGWNGWPDHARVTIDRVEDIDPRSCRCAAADRAEAQS